MNTNAIPEAARKAAWLLALALVLGGLAPVAAAAQDIPSYATGFSPAHDETINGRINSIDGKYALTVTDDRGFIDSVQLHQGTVINPTGLTLSPGMSVTILGYNAGNVFVANQVDTPYTFAGPAPIPVYYGPGWWYPGFAFGYGPSFSLFLNFGSFACVQRPWYGYWYVHPYVQPWVGYRPPFPAPWGAYRNIPHAGGPVGYHNGANWGGSGNGNPWHRFGGSEGAPGSSNQPRYPAQPGYSHAPAAGGRIGGHSPVYSGGQPSYSHNATYPGYAGVAHPAYPGSGSGAPRYGAETGYGARPSYGGGYSARPGYGGGYSARPSYGAPQGGGQPHGGGGAPAVHSGGGAGAPHGGGGHR